MKSVKIGDESHSVTIDGKTIETKHLIAEADYVVDSEPEIDFYTLTLIVSEDSWRELIDLESKLEIIGDTDETAKTQSNNFVISALNGLVWGCATNYTAHCVTKDHVMITLKAKESNYFDSFIDKYKLDPKFKMTTEVVKYNTRSGFDHKYRIKAPIF